MKRKRKIPLVVISDVHLGTYGCHANELLQYLKSINPKTLVLNGDIIDMWSFSKRYFPASHMNVLRHIIKMSKPMQYFWPWAAAVGPGWAPTVAGFPCLNLWTFLFDRLNPVTAVFMSPAVRVRVGHNFFRINLPATR